MNASLFHQNAGRLVAGALFAGMAWAVAPAAGAEVGTGAALPPLTVSDNGRFLTTEDGRPFFWLGDTAWELFHRLDREEALTYLDNRAAKKFNVIQAVGLAELEGLDVPNAYGKLPLVDRDPARPAVEADTAGPGGHYDYWDHVEFIVDEANRRGLYVGFVPNWGSYLRNWSSTDTRTRNLVFNEQNARIYGEFLGRRFGRKGIVWIVGGDRPADGVESITRALVAGILDGVKEVGGPAKPLMTFHPPGRTTSAKWFHHEDWLSFNMWQTGHGAMGEGASAFWAQVGADYARSPVKPVLDGEPLYEDHPVGYDAVRQLGYAQDWHVRQRTWWTVLAGGCGVTYGHHSVWQMYQEGRMPMNRPLMYWRDALDRPGAGQMRHLRALIESRPMLARVPDQSLLVEQLAGAEYVAAGRGEDYAFFYSAQGMPFTVNMGRISGEQVTAWWYNPRSGTSEKVGEFENRGTKEFSPPSRGGPGSDFVLVLDDASKRFGPPGKSL